jgi:hypothetical protein
MSESKPSVLPADKSQRDASQLDLVLKSRYRKKGHALKFSRQFRANPGQGR